MKDYERLAEAIRILEKHNKEPSDYNLNASHDTLTLCFAVKPEQLSPEEAARLEELRVFRNGEEMWVMNCSC